MQVKPEYEIVDEFAKIASKLTKKYPEVFYDLDINSVQCVAITNKERKGKKKLWEVKAVPMPIRMDCPFAYYIIVHMNDWVEMAEKHKALLLTDALLTIPTEEGQEGKLNAFDLKDFDLMIRNFGVDYLTREDVPDILADTIEWRKND